MIRALVVHRDARIAADEAAALRSLGYDVDRCPGPTGRSCPLVHGFPCPHAERADILVYDLVSLRHEEGGREVGEELRSLYADRPLVIVAGGVEQGALDPDDPTDGVVWLFGAPDPDRLADIIEDGLAVR